MPWWDSLGIAVYAFQSTAVSGLLLFTTRSQDFPWHIRTHSDSFTGFIKGALSWLKASLWFWRFTWTNFKPPPCRTLLFPLFIFLLSFLLKQTPWCCWTCSEKNKVTLPKFTNGGISIFYHWTSGCKLLGRTVLLDTIRITVSEALKQGWLRKKCSIWQNKVRYGKNKRKCPWDLNTDFDYGDTECAGKQEICALNYIERATECHRTTGLNHI